MTKQTYKPGIKPYTALTILAFNLRVRRIDCTAFVKAGFTLLEKKGLVELKRGVYRPGPGFWDLCESEGITEDGYLTARSESLAISKKDY